MSGVYERGRGLVGLQGAVKVLSHPLDPVQDPPSGKCLSADTSVEIGADV